MTTVFIAGSMNIKNLDPQVLDRINMIVKNDFPVVVGDADGADSSIQDYLFELGYSNLTVYCSGDSPRNNVGEWPINVVQTSCAPGTRQFFTAKDLAMAQIADVGLMIWDTKSTGTLSNVIELLTRKKKSVVFVNKKKTFHNVGSVDQLEALVGFMSEDAKRKANEKIRLFDRLNALRHYQSQMFA